MAAEDYIDDWDYDDGSDDEPTSVTSDCLRLKETDKAYGLYVGGKLTWFPKAHCELERVYSKDPAERRYRVTMPFWLYARKKVDARF